jgi:hypothetical protein
MPSNPSLLLAQYGFGRVSSLGRLAPDSIEDSPFYTVNPFRETQTSELLRSCFTHMCYYLAAFV